MEKRHTSKNKTYAAVAKGGQRTLQSLAHKEKIHLEHVNCGSKSSSQDPSISDETTEAQQCALESTNSDAKNDLCRGQRILTDIQIELIDKEGDPHNSMLLTALF